VTINQFLALTHSAKALASNSSVHARALRGGISTAFEHNALKYVAHHLPETADHTAGMRLCGIIGGNPKAVEPSTPTTFGATMRALTIKRTGSAPSLESVDSVANTLNALQSQRIDQAAQSINRLVNRAVAEGLPVDFTSIARTLYYWGHGFTEGSRKARGSILRDYYTPRSDDRNITNTENTIQEIAA